MDAATNKRIRAACRNESQKEQISLKVEAEKVIRKVEPTVSFHERSAIIDKDKITLNGKKDGQTRKDLE